MQTLTRERKARMHEAREAIIDRLAPNIHSEIDLDKFLHAVVAELGRMMDVDRCDVVQLVREVSPLHLLHFEQAPVKVVELVVQKTRL